MAAQLRRLQRSAGNAAVLRMPKQVAPPPVLAREPGAGGLIVDDEAVASAGQMRRGDFLDQVHARASAAATQELGLLFRIAGCPWLDHWVDYFRTRSPAAIESAIRRYAPRAAGATGAAQYLGAIEQRVGDGIRAWRQTGEIPPAPDVGEGSPGAPAPAGVARSVLDEPGRPLDAGIGGRLGAAFGRDLSGVRGHAGTPGAGPAAQLSARAVRVGRPVPSAPGEYEPGTPLGDALIAHELAHVIQQEDGGVARTPAPAGLEDDADRAAGLALLGRTGLPARRTGLTLQSCPGGTATASTFEDAVKDGKFDHAAGLLAAETDDAKIVAK